MAFCIRDFDLTRDKPAALSFITGSQEYERAMDIYRRAGYMPYTSELRKYL